MIFRMVEKSEQIFLPFCHNSRVWQTDRQNSHRYTASTASALHAARYEWTSWMRKICFGSTRLGIPHVTGFRL